MRGVGIVMGAGMLGLALTACGRDRDARKLPALSKATAASGPFSGNGEPFAGTASPGSVPCGASSACPITKASRRLCCNAPGVPPTCKDASKCGQATQFKYSGLLECNESADCSGSGVVCCLTDDGNRAEASVGKFNRSVCMPRTACVGGSGVACVTSTECARGSTCRKTSLGVGVDLGFCSP